MQGLHFLRYTLTKQIYSLNLLSSSKPIFSEISCFRDLKSLLEENKRVNTHLVCYIVCSHVGMFNNSKHKMYQKKNFFIFLEDFSKRLMIFRKTTYCAKIKGSQGSVFKHIVILVCIFVLSHCSS